MSGLFITFDGIDGCGKSTQLKKVGAFLEDRGIEYIVTREPGGTTISEKIREVILDPENSAMSDSCELLLYLAARAQHVEEKIKPHLERGVVVLCDRFQEATIAYQGYGRGYDIDRLVDLSTFAAGGLQPKRTYLFDLDVDTAEERMQKMGKRADRLEQSSKEFFKRVRGGYLSLAESNNYINIVDASQSIDDVFEYIRNDLNTLL